MINEQIYQIIIGILIADFVTIFFHWVEDTYFDYNMKIPFLRQIALDNELHHYYPRSIISYSYMENASVTTTLAVLLSYIIYSYYPDVVNKYKLTFIVFIIFASIANILHRFLHLRECEKSDFYKFLQKYIISDSEQHRTHHRESDKNYGVLFNFTNNLVTNLGIFTLLETILASIGIHKKPRKRYDFYEKGQTNFHEKSKYDCPEVLTLDEIEIVKKDLKTFFDNNPDVLN